MVFRTVISCIVNFCKRTSFPIALKLFFYRVNSRVNVILRIHFRIYMMRLYSTNIPAASTQTKNKQNAQHCTYNLLHKLPPMSIDRNQPYLVTQPFIFGSIALIGYFPFSVFALSCQNHAPSVIRAALPCPLGLIDIVITADRKNIALAVPFT